MTRGDKEKSLEGMRNNQNDKCDEGVRRKGESPMATILIGNCNENFSSNALILVIIVYKKIV